MVTPAKDQSSRSHPEVPAPDKVFETAADLVIRGNLAALAAALDEHPTLVRATSSRAHGATLLHYSAANGVEDEGQIAAPTRAGARVDNAANAAGMGDLPLLRSLVNPGPPPTADPSSLSTVKWIVPDPVAVPVLALYFASIAGRTDAARWLIQAGVDVNGTVHHGMTALHEACWGGHLDIVKLLVGAGADTRAVEEQHQATPAGWAHHAGHAHVVEYLKSQM